MSLGRFLGRLSTCCLTVGLIVMASKMTSQILSDLMAISVCTLLALWFWAEIKIIEWESRYQCPRCGSYGFDCCVAGNNCICVNCEDDDAKS